MTPMLIHCVGLAALASSASAFAQPAAAAPLTSPVSDGPSADSVDGLSGTATLTQTWPESAQTSRPPDFPRDHVGSPRRSALRERPPQPAVQSGSDGNVLVRIRQSANGWEFSVKDDGAGIGQIIPGLGTSLIDQFARQAGGQLSLEHANGTCVRLMLPPNAMRPAALLRGS